MSAYLAGLAILRCAEHDRAAELDPTARLVLAVMASFAGSEDRPECFAAQSSIAARAGLSRSTVKDALARLEKLGAIEHGSSKGKTVRWGLTLLWPGAGHKQTSLVAGSRPQATHGREPATSDGREPAISNGPGAGHNPSDSSRPLGREGGGSQDQALTRRPSADAAGSAPAPSNEPAAVSTVVAEVMAARGGTADDAQRWIERRLSAATRTVRNELAFIRGCLARERDSGDPAPRKAAKAAKPAKAAKATAAKAGKPAAAPTLCTHAGCRRRTDRRTYPGKAGLCEPHYAEAAGVKVVKPASAPVGNRATADPPPSTLDAQRPARRADGAVTPPAVTAPPRPPRPAPSTVAAPRSWQRPAGTDPFDPFGAARPVAAAQPSRGGRCAECGCWVTNDGHGHDEDCAG